MSRHATPKTRSLKPDPFYNSLLIQKITNHLMKNGKKRLAQKIINLTIQRIEIKTQQDPIRLIEKAISNIVPAVEIKSRRIGGAVYSIPTELSEERAISMAIRWLINCCKKRSSQTFVMQLTNEVIDASNKVGSAIRKKEEVHKIAESSTRLM